MSLSGHKFGAPKGIGALRIKGFSDDKVPLAPLTFGGGQEQGLRPGTLPVHLIGSIGLAAEIWHQTASQRTIKTIEFRKTLMSALAPLEPIYIGDQDNCLSNIVNLSIPGIDSEAFMLVVKDLISVSNGSACTSHRYEPSHVLNAMGLEECLKSSSVRMSWTPESVTPNWAEIRTRLASMR
jgi:cysteine desulfurase